MRNFFSFLHRNSYGRFTKDNFSYRNKDDVSGFSLSAAEELVCAIQTICRENNLNADDLVFSFSDVLNPLMRSREELKQLGIRRVRNFPIVVPLPKNLQNEQMTKLNLLQRADGPWFYVGLCEYTCAVDGPPFLTAKNKIKYWVFRGLNEYPITVPVTIIHKNEMSVLYRTLKKRAKTALIRIEPPILPRNQLVELYQNTVGFLKKGSSAFAKYNIPFKRGIIIQGDAGTGKTLSCKWLRGLCQRYGWETRVITLTEYRNASSRGNMNMLFDPFPTKKGMIFFDDLDVLLKDRRTGNVEVLNFLTQLDGMSVKEGKVYIFTTNEIEGLDQAAIRPNRIDLFIRMKKPNKELRKEFIEKKFQNEIKSKIDIEQLIEATEDYSFADLEEIRKLFCISLLDGKEVNLDSTLATYRSHRMQFPTPSMGFKIQEEDEFGPCFGPDEGTLPYPDFPGGF